MKGNIILLFLFLPIWQFAQVGINTAYPKAALHIDGATDNPKNNTDNVSNVQQINDFVVANNGNVGSGVIAPSNMLEVANNSAGIGTGLKLTTGAGAGKVLVSDNDGNAEWQSLDDSSFSKFYTVVTGAGGSAYYKPSSTGAWILYSGFTVVAVDEANQVFGGNYGWNIIATPADQYYKVPRTGKYRISLNVYYNSSGIAGENWLVGIERNGNPIPSAGMGTVPFSNVTSRLNDQSSFVSGTVILTKDDLLRVKLTNKTAGNNVAIYRSSSHTILTIEAL